MPTLKVKKYKTLRQRKDIIIHILSKLIADIELSEWISDKSHMLGGVEYKHEQIGSPLQTYTSDTGIREYELQLRYKINMNSREEVEIIKRRVNNERQTDSKKEK